MTLKLYYDLMSQPSRALYIFLKTCNIPFEPKKVNLMNGEHYTPEFKRINPFQKVPAIEHGGTPMIESIAILRYLCREFDVADHWYPKEFKLQVKVDEYLEWQHLNTRAYCGLYFRTKFLIPKLTGEPAKQEKVLQLEKQMIATLDDLENIWLKDKDFLTSSEISIADIIGACEVEQVRMCGYNPCEGRPRLATWMKRVATKTRPFYEEAHVILNKVEEINMKSCDTSYLASLMERPSRKFYPPPEPSNGYLYSLKISGNLKLDMEGSISLSHMEELLERLSGYLILIIMQNQPILQEACSNLMRYIYECFKKHLPWNSQIASNDKNRTFSSIDLSGYTLYSCVNQELKTRIPVSIACEVTTTPMHSCPTIVTVRGEINLETGVIISRDDWEAAGLSSISYPPPRWMIKAKNLLSEFSEKKNISLAMESIWSSNFTLNQRPKFKFY